MKNKQNVEVLNNKLKVQSIDQLKFCTYFMNVKNAVVT